MRRSDWNETPRPSKYTFRDIEGGFEIGAPGKPRVHIITNGFGFRVVEVGDPLLGENISFYAFPEWGKIISHAVDVLYSDWHGDGRQDDRFFMNIRRWARKQTERSIAGRIQRKCHELARTYPDIYALQRRLWGICGRYVPYAALWPELYEHKYLLKDLWKYRAADLTLATIHILITNYRRFSKERSTTIGGITYLVSESNHEDMLTRSDILNIFEENWRGLLSPTLRSYKSLNETLDDLPGGITPFILTRLQKRSLRRPIIDRLEFIGVMAAENHMPIFHNARRDEIAEIILRGGGNIRSCNDVYRICCFADDYPDEHHGRVPALMTASERWHEREDQCSHKDIDPLALLLLPPSEPIDDGVCLLKTPQELWDEGKKMHNCVGSYTNRALQGDCYLLHVDRGEFMATAEVSPAGQISQVLGPCNERSNPAVRYAKRVLPAWIETWVGQNIICQQSQNNNKGVEDDYDDLPF